MFSKTQLLQFLFFSIIFFILTSITFGQAYKITGVLIDSTKEPLESATVYIISAKDSSTVDYTISNSKGQFELKGKTKVDEVDFYVSFVGFNTYMKRLSLKQKPINNLGTITLKESNNSLDEVLVQGEAPPVKLKEDTLEFNANSFNTKEDANLEDLLKKLPGVTVDNKGNIKINGKDVNNIKVNGKDFFGDDPKIATKNLPKDIIDKVQVVDTKSKSDEFTGKETDSQDKTINITIKKDQNKGFFARMTAGGGTDERFSLNGIANYFNNDLRLSALGSANNINSIGFSFDEVYDAMGRSAYSIMNQGGGGITKSQSGGLNFTNSWDKITNLSANYFFNRASTRSENKIERENILPERQYFNNSNSNSKKVNNNHRANIAFEYEPDSMTRIYVYPKIIVNEGYSDNSSITESREPGGMLLNNANTKVHNDVQSINFSNRMGIIRKYGNKGGYSSLSFNNTNNTEDNKQLNFTSRKIFNDDGTLKEAAVQDQQIKKNTSKDNYSIDASIRLPLSEKWKLDFGYDFSTTNDENERLVYEKDEDIGLYLKRNENLSSRFNAQSYTHRPKAGLAFVGKKLTADLSGGIESIRLKDQEQFTNTSFDNTYNNLYARLFFRYKISRTKSIFFRYRNSRDVPSITQLQPVTNTTNPLNIITGNPELEPSLTNTVYLNYNNYNYKSKTGFYAYIYGRYYNDKVVAQTITDDDLVRTTSYINVDGTYNINGGISLNKNLKLKDGGSLKPKINLSSGYNKDIGFSNAIKYNSQTWSVSTNLGIEYDYPDVINIGPYYQPSFHNTIYSLNNQRDQNYINHEVGIQITSYLPKKFVIGNDISYNHIGNAPMGFGNDYVLWNLSLGYKILGDDGIFKIKVFDLLNQNVSTTRFTGEDYNQTTEQLVLQRYLMFSFTYKLSKFAGKKERKDHRYHR